MKLPSLRLLAALLVAGAFLTLALTDAQPANLLKSRSGAKGVAIDRAFVELMVPTERRFIALARIARSKASHGELRRVARRWIPKRRAEIRALLRVAPGIEAQVPDGAVPPLAQGSGDSGALGLVPFDAGLGVGSVDLTHRRTVDPAVLNRLIRLAQGTIRMARVEFTGGDIAELKHLSRPLLWGRFEQIFRLNAWYTRWYGRAAPAGGIPAGA